MSQGDKQYYIIEVWDVSIDRIFETGYYFVRKDQLLLVSTIECSFEIFQWNSSRLI